MVTDLDVVGQLNHPQPRNAPFVRSIPMTIDLLASMRQATELDPGDAGSHHALGRAFLHGGRFEEATASLRLAITLKDDLAAAHCDLAVALDELGADGAGS
jgi:Flp pilus assembly protein TadD